MPTRKLSNQELAHAKALLERTRAALMELAGDDGQKLFAYRRKLWKELVYDERLKPSQRAALRRRKVAEQQGLCPICKTPLPPKGFDAILDRLDAMIGYTDSNVRLIHRSCDLTVQKERGFKG